MRALAGYILRGRLQAVAVTSLFGLLSLFIPPLAYLFGGVPLALVCLRIGPLAAVQVMLGSLAVVLLGLLLIGAAPVFALSLLLSVWLPVTFCSVYLRRTESQAVMLLAAASIAAGFSAVLYLVVGDVEAWWHDQLAPQLQEALAGRTELPVEQLLAEVLPYINGMVAAGLVLSLAVSVLIARWLQAALFNPGGFGAEFRTLLVPRWLVIVTLIGLAGAILLEGPLSGWLRDLVFVGMAVFLFQGLALCHLQVHARGWSRHWLWLLYILLLLLPQAILFVASMGLADAWLRGSGVPGPGDRSENERPDDDKKDSDDRGDSDK